MKQTARTEAVPFNIESRDAEFYPTTPTDLWRDARIAAYPMWLERQLRQR